MTNYTNLVLLGDFSIHNQDMENPDSITYNDMMVALGLLQPIDKPPHKFGNTLDLIYMESLNRVRVIHSFIGNFISNHRIVRIELEIKKQLEKCQSTKHRNYRDFNLNNFSQVFNNSKILDQSSLEDAVQAFNEEMEKILGKIAPIEEKRNLRDKTSHGILANYPNREKSEIKKEHTWHIEKINTGRHIPWNETDTMKC